MWIPTEGKVQSLLRHGIEPMAYSTWSKGNLRRKEGDWKREGLGRVCKKTGSRTRLPLCFEGKSQAVGGADLWPHAITQGHGCPRRCCGKWRNGPNGVGRPRGQFRAVQAASLPEIGQGREKKCRSWEELPSYAYKHIKKKSRVNRNTSLLVGICTPYTPALCRSKVFRCQFPVHRGPGHVPAVDGLGQRSEERRVG